MSIYDNAPQDWPRFVSLVKQNAPTPPEMSRTNADEVRRDIARGWGVLSTFLGAIGVNVPDEVGDLMTVVTGDSVLGVAQSVAEGRVLGRVAGGTIIGGGVETVRGGYQQLSRNHEMTTYLLGMMGYLTTLGRMCCSAMMDRRHDIAYPAPLIPTDVENSGAVYSAHLRAKYRAGAEAAWRVVQAMDSLRPADQSRDLYSKVCLTHVAIQTGQTSTQGLGERRMRDQCARIIARSILTTDLDAARERMRRWAVSG